jgi:hypothetical protein
MNVVENVQHASCDILTAESNWDCETSARSRRTRTITSDPRRSPLKERSRPTRSHSARPPTGAASMDTLKAALMPGGKPLNSKRLYNRVHSQDEKNPYDT